MLSIILDSLVLTENHWIQVRHGYHHGNQKLYHSLILTPFVLCPGQSSEPFSTQTPKTDTTDRTKSTPGMTIIYHLWYCFLNMDFSYDLYQLLKDQLFCDINNSLYYLLQSGMMWQSSNLLLLTILSSVITCHVCLLVDLRDAQELGILLFAALPCLMPG